VPHRHAPPRWRRPRGSQVHFRSRSRSAGGRDHGAWQYRKCGGGAEGGRVRLSRQAGFSGAVAHAGEICPVAAARRCQREGDRRACLARRVGRDAAGAGPDRKARPFRSAGARERRVGLRKGACRPAHSRQERTARQTVCAGELRRHSGEPDGIGILRLPQGSLSPERTPIATGSSRRQTAARCSSTRLPIFHSRCK
jgi:hypothetical protein